MQTIIALMDLRDLRLERYKPAPLPPCTTRNQHGNSERKIFKFDVGILFIKESKI
jgi:hypothetical protein